MARGPELDLAAIRQNEIGEHRVEIERLKTLQHYRRPAKIRIGVRRGEVNRAAIWKGNRIHAWGKRGVVAGFRAVDLPSIGMSPPPGQTKRTIRRISAVRG